MPLLLAGAAAAAQAPPKAAPKKPPATAPAKPTVQLPNGAQVVLQDRVIAVVNEDPILASEIERAIALGLAQAREGEGEVAFRRRVLNQLVEDRLRFHEIDRYGFEQVPVDLIDKHVAQVRARFASEAEFQKTLRNLGMSFRGLRQLVARQLMVLTYVDEQLGPRVFVSLDDINRYHRDVLTPAMQKQGQPVPPVEDVREQIRTVLKEERVNREIGKWTEELRRKADINVYFDAPANPKGLPPVVKRIP